MNKFIKILIFLFLLVFMGLAVKFVFVRPTENEKIEILLNQAMEAFAAKSSSKVLEYLSDDFSTSSNLDRDELKMQLKAFFFQVRKLRASIEYIKHEKQDLPNTASAAKLLVVVKVTGETNGQKFQAFGGQGADAFLIKLTKQNDLWKVAKAKYIDTKNPSDNFAELKNF